MKILCLYNNDIALELFSWLKDSGHETALHSERLTARWCQERKFDLAVSYTYRYILEESVLKALEYNAVNIHTSYLPFNRGADPNIWSVIDGTPRGVTLHYIDVRLDHGDIIAQVLAPGSSKATLATSYEELDRAAKRLFKDAFQYYPFWSAMRKSVKGMGNYHKSAEAKALKESVPSYDISVDDFKALSAGILHGVGSKGKL